MNARTTRTRLGTVAVAAVILVAVGVLGRAATIDPSTEGYDLMRQITTQFVRPNLLIVLDVSGSMAYEPTSDRSVGVDSFGLPSFNRWSVTSTTATRGVLCYYSRYLWTATYTFKLSTTNRNPARMDIFKNALGNSVPIYDNPTIVWPDTWPRTYQVKDATGAMRTYVYSHPAGAAYAQWVITYTNCGYSAAAPPAPFTPQWSTPDYSQSPPVKPLVETADLGVVPATLPQDLVGKSRTKVNWGLEIFSTDFTFRDYDGVTRTADAHRLVDVEADDTQAVQDGVVAAIEPYLKPEALGGLTSHNSTATSAALNMAKASLNATATTGGPGGTADAKIACKRFYGVVLVTDGASNSCNPYDDYQSCATSAPAGWALYPEGRSNELFVKTRDSSSGCSNSYTSPVPVRTFAVGVSTSVSRCELNLDAFMGRTDASSVKGDAGLDIVGDTYGGRARLPLNVPTDNNYFPDPLAAGLTRGTSTATTNYRPVAEDCASDCMDYAFFASDANALYRAFAMIVAAVGTGDYTTSAPSTTAAPSLVSGGQGFESVGLLTAASYPGFKGHMYAYDLYRPTGNPPPDNFPLFWDAGDVLSNHANNGLTRSIYTWNPALLGTGTDPLIRIQTQSDGSVAPALVAQLDTLCGSCGITANVVDYIVGDNGALTRTGRAWKMGSVINSTPAVVGPPEAWLQTTLPHAAFEAAQASRHPLVWVGSDDGMVHAFDLVDGAEIIALLPPDQLAKQVGFYSNYTTNPTSEPTGEPVLADDHVYGVANSMRFADVWAANDSGKWPCETVDSAGGCFKTLLFITEGPGGTGLYAIDVTHPYPGRTAVTVPPVYPTPTPTPAPTAAAGATPTPTVCPMPTATPPPTATPGPTPTPLPTTSKDYDSDSGYDSGQPVLPLWGYTADGAGSTAVLSALAQTWSVPAIGMVDNAGTWQLVVGEGYNDAETAPPYSAPKVIKINPATGSLSGTIYGAQTLTNQSTAYVRNQAFADDVVIQKDADLFKPDNLVTQGIQLDLHGQIWLLEGASWTATALSGLTGLAGNPLYFSPAVANYPSSKPALYDLYAFSSGSFYEKSPNVTGPNVGQSGYFQPSMYLVSRSVSSGAATIKQIALAGLSDGCDTLSDATQMTSYPQILVPQSGKTGDALALFTAYDPNSGACVGNAYLIKVAFDPASLATTVNVFNGGAGASPGWVITPEGPVFGKSFVGQNGRAYFDVPREKINIPPPGGNGGTVNWWVELQ